MSPSARLTEEENQNGKRAVLIPSQEIQKKMQPITREDFPRLVKKAIPPSPPPAGRICCACEMAATLTAMKMIVLGRAQ